MFFLDLQTLRSGDEGWLVLDITAASDRWLLNHNKDLGLRLYVETEDGEAPGLSRELPRGLGRWFQQRPPGQYTEPSHWGGGWLAFPEDLSRLVRAWTWGGPSQECLLFPHT